jgi:hypothetical protein
MSRALPVADAPTGWAPRPGAAHLCRRTRDSKSRNELPVRSEIERPNAL